MSKETTQVTKKASVPLIVKAGRGNLGGSTFLTAICEIAASASRNFLMADGDMRNPGISASPLYARYGLPRPVSEDEHDISEWFSMVFSAATEKRLPLVLDIGGGDRTMEQWAAEVDLVAFAESAGLEVCGLFFCGGDADDLAYITRLWETGKFRPTKGAVVFNAMTVPSGQAGSDILQSRAADPSLKPLFTAGIETLKFPKLGCMAAVKETGLSYHDAAAGKIGSGGKPIDPVKRFMVTRWLSTIRQNIEVAGLQEMLP
ncbi:MULTISPECIES: hypothetical protein [Komagataeibacter]|uniref:hypothetical protein n=1 Tax=Komagataeibacter TaxID=1434011 RepID=UPI000C8188B8|nr:MULTISPECIES: hypothetical protein [Komagataeibacter]QBL95601.1 hypothetical protein KSAC_34220 [Komagataeibacter saccharivorans]